MFGIIKAHDVIMFHTNSFKLCMDNRDLAYWSLSKKKMICLDIDCWSSNKFSKQRICLLFILLYKIMKICIYEINTKSGKILINYSIEAEFFHYCSDHVFQCNFCFITQTKNVKDWKYTLT